MLTVTISKPVRVVYIAGYGRSGTTILDIALGQHSVVMGAGEITALTRHVWQENEYCACGARFVTASFGVQSCNNGSKVRTL